MFRTIFPVESMFVALFAVGEGWHNYHHAFPWDYRASELGSPLNVTGFLIDMLAKIGAVYDRKEATHNMIKNRVLRTGEGSHREYGNDEGRSAIKTLFNIWKHPCNPTYTSKLAPKPKIINSNGYALDTTEMPKNELDEDILSRENSELEMKQYIKQAKLDSGPIAKYIVEKPVATTNTLMGKLTKFMHDTDTCVSSAGTGSADLNECNNNGSLRVVKKKSELNINVDDVLLVKI